MCIRDRLALLLLCTRRRRVVPCSSAGSDPSRWGSPEPSVSRRVPAATPSSQSPGRGVVLTAQPAVAADGHVGRPSGFLSRPPLNGDNVGQLLGVQVQSTAV